MFDDFRNYLMNEGKSNNTINSYIRHLNGYISWYSDSFGEDFHKLYRENILDFVSYLKNIKKDNAKTIKAKLAALTKYNEYLIEKGIQEKKVVTKKDNIKVQQQYASPCNITKDEVEAFRQKILKQGDKRDYALATLFAYTGLRISEALSLTLNDVNLTAREIIVRSGKGDKQRVVFVNDKVVNAIREYLNVRNSNSEYLFVSRQSGKINRTRINQIFNQYSDKITPHVLRHFYCSNALESGYSVHEVANQAGHSNIHTTLIYTNPSREKMKEKANLL